MQRVVCPSLSISRKTTKDRWEIDSERQQWKDGMVSHIGIKHQVDAWYADEEKLQLARDWNTAVVTPEQINFS